MNWVPVTAKPELIYYSYLGNHKFWVNYDADVKTSQPVILYGHADLVDRLGQSGAAKQGYDLLQFVQAFERQGFATVVPLEGPLRIQQFQGALRYIYNHPRFDSKRIYIVAHGRRAFLGAILINEQPGKVKGFVQIAPKGMDRSGYYSFKKLHQKAEDFPPMPVFQLLSETESAWNLRMQTIMTQLLSNTAVDLSVQVYAYTPQWFLDSRHDFFEDIITFLHTQERPINESGRMEF